jgi:hypothetical protein
VEYSTWKFKMGLFYGQYRANPTASKSVTSVTCFTFSLTYSSNSQSSFFFVEVVWTRTIYNDEMMSSVLLTADRGWFYF